MIVLSVLHALPCLSLFSCETRAPALQLSVACGPLVPVNRSFFALSTLVPLSGEVCSTVFTNDYLEAECCY
jgi:hypothetical protein